MTPIGQKRLALVGALLLAAGGLSYIAWGGIEKNIVYFWDVKTLLTMGKQAEGASVRLGGLVQKGSIVWDHNTLELTFRMGMEAEGGDSVIVKSRGAPPQMFREGIGAVVEGTYAGAMFDAQRVIVKHSNEYRPPAEGERPEQVYKTLLEQ